MKPEAVIIICLCIAAVIFYSIFESRQRRKRFRLWLAESFGKKPDEESGKEKDREAIALWYELTKENVPEEEQVDEITWNDLEMDRIFDRINTTGSFVGEQVLFAELHRLPKDKEILQKREQTIRYFSEHAKERVDAQMKLRQLKKTRVNYYIPAYAEVLEQQRIPRIMIYRILFCSLILLLAGAVFTGNLFLVGAAVCNAVVNIAVYALGKAKYEVFMESLYGIVRMIKTAGELSAMREEDWFPIRETAAALDKLTDKILAFEARKKGSAGGDLGSMLSDYLLGVFLWDFLSYDQALRRLAGRQKEYMELYQFVGEVDCCIAAASFRKSVKSWCIPQFDADSLIMKGLYHPMIDNAVENDFEMKRNLILTGSNASGKSTFMKAVAVNLILGQSIHTCTADAMAIPDVRVLTSMAVRDDVMSGESYYMREIKYLNRMVEKSRGERKVFCGIDEILRGTNTTERVAASISILNYLSDKNCLIMVASHDIELAKTMEGLYDNYHFCESVQGGDVVFDYRLKKGICDSRNAIRLLKAVGFPEEIVEEAEVRAGAFKNGFTNR